MRVSTARPAGQTPTTGNGSPTTTISEATGSTVIWTNAAKGPTGISTDAATASNAPGTDATADQVRLTLRAATNPATFRASPPAS